MPVRSSGLTSMSFSSKVWAMRLNLLTDSRAFYFDMSKIEDRSIVCVSVNLTLGSNVFILGRVGLSYFMGLP